MGYGFIRKPEDIKCLILFSLAKLPFALEDKYLYELVNIDNGFDYFDFAEAVAELSELGHISSADTEKGKLFVITPSGMAINRDIGNHLPPSVRERAERRALEVIATIRRDRSIKATRTKNPDDGTFDVHLALLDSGAEVFSINIHLYSERQCSIIEGNFKRGAEKIYPAVLDLISAENPEDMI